MALVLSHMRKTLSNLTPKSLTVCTIQRIIEQQLAAATYSASVVDCANERRSKKMTSHISALSINPTTHKISIKKANKIKGRRDRISNLKLSSVFKIPENSLDCRPMRRVWGTLKARTQPHGELNVRLCRCEVQKRVDHACDILAQGLIGLIEYSYHQGIPSFL
jgi:hypothetical protein